MAFLKGGRHAAAYLVGLAIAAAFVVVVPTRATGQVARLAIVVGSNRGVDPERTLRFAERDAHRFATLLETLGGFQKENVYLLMGPSPSDIIRTIEALNRKIHTLVPSKFQKALAVVYFSGHADGVHLELGQNRLEFSKLRSSVEKLDAEVKILLVDSCQSGGLTAFKGGRPGPSFDLVVSDTIDANGTAILTSSAAGEMSQESGQLEGSFFTHFLISGLRGTADFDQDQRITLAEIYQYTYNKTVAETARTMGGAQHPTYDYRISGRGKVVLTDLTLGETQLQFGPETSGTYFVLNKETSEIVAEVSKQKGTWRSVAVPADTYLIAMKRDHTLLSDEVALKYGQRVRFNPANMTNQRTLYANLDKGSQRPHKVGIHAYYGLMSGALKHYAALHQGIIGLRWDIGPVTLFPRVSIGATNVQEDDLSYSILLLSGESALAWRFEYSLLDFFAGIGATVGYGRQQIADGDIFTGTIFSYAGVGGLDVPFSSGLALSLFWDVGSQVFRAENKLKQHLLLRCALGMGYHF